MQQGCIGYIVLEGQLQLEYLLRFLFIVAFTKTLMVKDKCRFFFWFSNMNFLTRQTNFLLWPNYSIACNRITVFILIHWQNWFNRTIILILIEYQFWFYIKTWFCTQSLLRFLGCQLICLCSLSLLQFVEFKNWHWKWDNLLANWFWCDLSKFHRARTTAWGVIHHSTMMGAATTAQWSHENYVQTQPTTARQALVSIEQTKRLASCAICRQIPRPMRIRNQSHDNHHNCQICGNHDRNVKSCHLYCAPGHLKQKGSDQGKRSATLVIYLTFIKYLLSILSQQHCGLILWSVMLHH